MQARRSHEAAGWAALGLATILAHGCGHPAVEKAAKAQAAVPAPATRVTAIKPTRETIRRTTEQPGQIEAAETTPIHARLAGYVEKVAVDIGDVVGKGQLLAVLRVPEVEADLKQKQAAVRQAEAERKQAVAAVGVAGAGVASARAKVEEIQSGMRRAEADATRWRAEFARVDQLGREKALTGSLVDETRSKLQAAEAGRDEVKAKVASAEASQAEAQASLDKARSDLDAAASHIEVTRFEAERAAAMEGYTRIVAPYAGVVTRRGIDTGHLTSAGPDSDPLFVVARSDTVTIAVGVPEIEAALVGTGDRASVRLQALEGRTFEGKVARTAWALDSSTRTLRTEIDLPNPDGTLRPGLYAYASIVSEEHKGVLTLPASAVFSAGGKSYCVAVQGGVARRKEIKTGLGDGKRVEVVSGLAPDDLVVETNPIALADGQPLARNEPPAEAPKAKN